MNKYSQLRKTVAKANAAKKGKGAKQAKSAVKNIKSGNPRSKSAPKKGAMPAKKKAAVKKPAAKSHSSFGSAFAAARKSGKKTFKWTNPKTGKTGTYGTKLKSEVNKKAKVAPKKPNLIPKSPARKLKSNKPQVKPLNKKQLATAKAERNMKAYAKKKKTQRAYGNKSTKYRGVKAQNRQIKRKSNISAKRPNLRK